MDPKSYNPLGRLQPPEPTPKEEICSCEGNRPLKLMPHLGYNPLACVNCNLEIPLGELPLSTSLIEDLARWNSLYTAIDCLWLDSGAYESWAKGQLSDINSPVNMLGRELQRSVDKLQRCYFWFFQDESAPDYTPLDRCPVCEAGLIIYDRGIFEQRLCEACGIIVPGVQQVS